MDYVQKVDVVDDEREKIWERIEGVE